MLIYRHTNSILNSNTWILLDDQSNEAWIVDCGDASSIMNRFNNVKGIFVTHSHFDHIYGMNDIENRCTNITVYCSNHAKRGLYSSKLNCSLYHEKDFEFIGKNVVTLENGDCLHISDSFEVEVVATPGHDAGCLSYVVGDYIFTGDSFIPGIKTVTHLRGNKAEAQASEERIKELIRERHLTVCPGHGDMYTYSYLVSKNLI